VGSSAPPAGVEDDPAREPKAPIVVAPGPGGVLIVHHDRDPLLLYPELVQIGWWAERIAGDPGEVRLRLAAAS